MRLRTKLSRGADLLLGKVLQLVAGVDSILALFPTGRADFSVFIHELESLDDSERLFDGSTDGQVVDVGCPEDTLGVDEEGASERDTFLLKVDTVGFGEGVVPVRVLKVSNCFKFPWKGDEVTESGIRQER